MRRPHILMLMDDQHRGDCLGVDGNKVIRTPHLDHLAAEGACFRRAYSSLPSCTPARTSLLTGRSPWGHGMLGYGKVAERYPVEKPRVLAESGYSTTVIGKCHYSPQRNGHGYGRMILDESSRAETPEFRSDYISWLFAQNPTVDPFVTGIGFNSYRSGPYALPEEWHPTHWTGSTAVNFIDNYKQKEPFFLKVSFARPHSPYDPPQRFYDMYKDADLPKAHVGKWSNDWYGSFTKPEPDTLARGNLGPEQVRRSRQGYYGNITFIDEQIGRIIDALGKRDILEDTLILFTADHGDMTGDHHLWRKAYAYEASARVPMIVRWPKDWIEAKRGQHLNQPVELRDVLPTFLHAADVPIPDSVEGRSLLELITGHTDQWRPWIDLEHAQCYFNENQWNALTDGKQKYIYHAFTGAEQLFDLTADPGETDDLSTSTAHAADLKTWRDRMITHLTPRGPKWVKDGQLQLRKQRTIYGDNYPKPA